MCPSRMFFDTRLPMVIILMKIPIRIKVKPIRIFISIEPTSMPVPIVVRDNELSMKPLPKIIDMILINLTIE